MPSTDDHAHMATTMWAQHPCHYNKHGPVTQQLRAVVCSGGKHVKLCNTLGSELVMCLDLLPAAAARVPASAHWAQALASRTLAHWVHIQWHSGQHTTAAPQA
jgi:hypothetical protein